MRFLSVFFLSFFLSAASCSASSSNLLFNESFNSPSIVQANGGNASNVMFVTGLLRRGILMQSGDGNLLDNPGFEVKNSYMPGFREWDIHEGNCEPGKFNVSEDMTVKFEGDRSARIVNKCNWWETWLGQAWGSSGWSNSGFRPYAGTYRFKVYAKGSGSLILAVWDGVMTGYSTAYNLDDNWRLYSYNYTLSPDASTVYPLFMAGANSTIWLDSAELTSNVVQTLSYPTSGRFDPDQGTIELWIKPRWNGDERNKTHVLFSTNKAGADGWGEFVIGKWWDRSAIVLKVFDWTSAQIDTSAWKAGEWHHIAATWGNGTAKYYADGQPASTGTYTPGTFSSDKFYVGSAYFGTYQADAVIDEMKIYDYAKNYGSLILPTRCGDGIWDNGENLTNCPQDCTEFCNPPPDDLAILPTGNYTIGTFVMPAWHNDTGSSFSPNDYSEWDFTTWEAIWNIEIEASTLVPGSDQPKVPLMNYYDSSNPVAVDWMIKLGLEHGVSLYVYDWYWYRGREYYGAPLSSFISSKYFSRYPEKLKFAVMFTNYDYNYSGIENDLENMMDYDIKNYFKYQNYLKTNNKPVLYIYNAPEITRVLGRQGAINLFAKWRQMARDAGYDGLILISLYCSSVPVLTCADTSIGLDGDTFYACIDYGNYPTYNGVRYTSYENFMSQYEGFWNDIYNCPGNYVMPTITPDWDSTPYGSAGVAVVNSTPGKYKTMAQKAKDYVDSKGITPKIILSEAWDEWTEGAVLAPTKRWGTAYLDSLAEVFGQNPDPIGNFEYAGCDYISGWTCDENNYTQPLWVHYYADGAAGNGTFLGGNVADLTREQAVGNVCGGYRAHGFRFPTPVSLKNNSLQNIYVYAINTPSGNNPLLGNKTIRCTTTTTTTTSRTTSSASTTSSTTTTPSHLDGDADGDGHVDYPDLIILAASYGTTNADNGYDARADFNSDGAIGYDDLIILAANYGT